MNFFRTTDTTNTTDTTIWKPRLKQFSVKGPVGFILDLVFAPFFLLVLLQGVHYVEALQRYVLQV